MKTGRTSKSAPCTIFSVLISFFFFLRTESRAFAPSLSLTVPTNLTSLWAYRHCVSDPSWNPQGLFIASSCENALVALWDDASTWGLHPGTFTYNPGGRSTAYFPGASSPITLPKRYVSGNCVVAIVMMKMFERSRVGQFPGLPDSLIGKWRYRDTSTSNALVEPAEYVRATCENGCGYAILGREFGIGVVTWGTGSKWDWYVRDLSLLSETDTVLPGLGVGNTSVVGLGNGSILETLR